MKNSDFGCAGNFGVLVPYQDLLKIAEVATNMDEYKRTLSRTSEQLSALRLMYTELLEKVQALERYS